MLESRKRMGIEKDWTGNKKTAFAALGASNHSEGEREEHDYYATEPFAAEELLRIEPELNDIWECACGEGHLAEVFAKVGKLGSATDLIDRGYGHGGYDFLSRDWEWDGDIVTNPPYKYAREFIEKSLASIKVGRKVCMFLKLNFLESKGRKQLFTDTPPKTVWVISSRLNCAKNGDFETFGTNSAAAYAWFVWEKGYTGNTTLKWFN